MAHKKIYQICGAVLSAAVLLTSLPQDMFPFFGNENIAVVHAAQTLNGHEFLAENSNYRLYYSEEDLSLVVEDKATGKYMESAVSYDDGKNNDTWLGAMHSAVVITMINRNDDTKQADLVNDRVQKKITKTANGFTAELYWTTYKFGVTLEVELTDDGLTARIPEESIREDGEQYYIGTLAMYPYMGNSYLDDKEGYLFVPDGNGALIYLDDKEGRFKSGYSGMIYGKDVGFDESFVQTLLWDKYDMVSDAEETIAPIFGIAHTDDKIAYLGIVEEGDQRASIEVIPNGVSVNYNRAYAKFVLRKLYTQPTSNNSTSGSLHTYESDRSHSNLKVRYIFLSGDEADYSGMANAYRNYLLKNGQLVPQDDTYRTRIDFLGTERENWVIGTSAVVMTTVEDIRRIYEDLENEGMTDILSVYKGWQKGGLYDLPISSYEADAKIGGTGDLTRLIKDTDEKGIRLYLYNNALVINPDENNATFNIIKKVNKRRFELETYREVYDTLLYLTPARSDYLLDKFVKSYTKKGVNHLAVAGISNKLFTYTYSGTKYTRFETAGVYADTIQKLAGRTDLILEQPFSYLWKDTKAFLDMPMYTSSYILEDESIPFLSIVLKGVLPIYSEYVNFEANKKEFFLKMVESGTFPSFYITKADSSDLLYTNSSDVYSSQYDTYRSTILEYDQALEVLNAKVKGATIRKHEILEPGLVRVTYSNNVKVYLNYNKISKTVDGITVAGMSYEVIA